MLSREHVIHRSAGEERRARVVPSGRTWPKAVLLILIAGLLAAFVLLNRGAIVEPRVDLGLWSLQRPSLLIVMFLTSSISAAGALLVRAALSTMTPLREPPARTLLSPPPRPAAPTKGPALIGALTTGA
jgi:hypothetical protein